MAVLYNPVVLLRRAREPTAVKLLTVVACNALSPTATLKLPVALSRNAWKPIAVLLDPAVLVSRAL